MKRILSICIIGVMIMITLSGCTGFYQRIPKDTVMVKTLEINEPFKVKDGTLLSEETIKSLAVNAIKKYYNHNLSVDHVEIELISVDYNDIKTLLASATRYLNLDQDTLNIYTDQLSKASSGLYLATITNIFNDYDVYGVTINPLNGDIIGASHVLQDSKIITDVEQPDEYYYQMVTKFIEEKEIIKTAVDPDYLRIFQSINGMSTVYYISEDKQTIFHVTINRSTEDIMEFSKDVLAAIQMAAINSKSIDKKAK